MIERCALIFPWIIFGLVWLIAAPFSKKTVRSDSGRWKYLLPVLLLFAVQELGVLRAVWPGVYRSVLVETPVLRAVSYAFVYGGIGFAIWARGVIGSLWSGSITLKEDHRLVQSGPFAITRHPIYSGLLLASLGVVIYVGSTFALVAFAVMVASFVKKLTREEALMRETFGDEHRAYTERVRKLVPYLW